MPKGRSKASLDIVMFAYGHQYPEEKYEERGEKLERGDREERKDRGDRGERGEILFCFLQKKEGRGEKAEDSLHTSAQVHLLLCTSS